MEILKEFPSVPLLSAFLHLDVLQTWSRYSVHFHVKIPLRASSLCTSTPLFSRLSLRTDLHLRKTCFRPHQVFVGRCISSTPITHRSTCSFDCTHFVIGNQKNTDSSNMHESDTYGIPSKYRNGILPSGRTVNLVSTNLA